MRRIVLALAGLLAAIPMAGSAPVKAAGNAAPTPLLWKVSDRDNHVYLLGSFHLLRKTDYPLSPDVDAALADAESVAFEITPRELNDPQLGARMLERASGPKGTLAEVASPALRRAFDARLQRLGLPAGSLDRFEPWFASVTAVSVLGMQMGFSPEDGLDRHLMARAETLRKPVTGLETIDAQLDAMESTPVAEQLASLEDFVDEKEDARAQLEQLHGAWRRGDVAMLERLAQREMRDRTPVSYQRLNVARNRAWLPKLESMLAKGRGHDALVVVGALHLLGDDGVVELLRARGYRVERICRACAPAAPGKRTR
ncbi:TraB/GumN family protein [Lysobacter humi (ex Lee et al. 2017)]